MELIDVQKLLGQFLGTQGHASHHGTRPGSGHGGPSGGFLGGSAGSAVSAALASGLASKLFRAKGLGGMGGSAGKYGSAALVAGLAYKAFQAYQERSRPAPAPAPSQGSSARRFGELPQAAGTPFLPQGEEDRRARLMLSAMIAAAKADGYIDRDEQEAIFGKIDEAGLDAEEKGFLVDEMRRPATIDDLVAKARGPEEAAEVYTASLLAIDPDHPAERAYLDLLAARLGLDPALVAEIRHTTDAARDA